jgi:hypothetical protein
MSALARGWMHTGVPHGIKGVDRDVRKALLIALKKGSQIKKVERNRATSRWDGWRFVAFAALKAWTARVPNLSFWQNRIFRRYDYERP